MSHRYAEIVQVQLDGEAPRTLCWRGRTYQVVEVLATWHLRTRWWQRSPVESVTGQSEEHDQAQAYSSAQAPAQHPSQSHVPSHVSSHIPSHAQKTLPAPKPPSDRHYFRLTCIPSLICELYFDAEPGSWILDRVYD